MKEININIEGYNVNGICVGCLNYNRKMFYDDDVKECLKRIGDIEIPEELSVQLCWECLAVVKKIKKFQEKVLRSYNILIEYSHKHTYLYSPEELTQYAFTDLGTTEVQHKCVYVSDTDTTKEEVKEEHEAFTELNVEFDSVKDERDLDDSQFSEDFLSQEFEDGRKCETKIQYESDEDIHLSELKRKKERKGKGKKAKIKEPKLPRKLKNLPSSIVELHTMTEEEMWSIRSEDVISEAFQRIRYKCEDCIIGFNTEKLRDYHFNKKHKAKGNKYQCDVCKAYFLNKDNLTSHRDLHLAAYRCTQCALTTTLKKRVVQHECATKIYHEYKCADCDKTFSSKSKLSYHKNVCHQEKPQCDCCGKVFANKMTLKYHLKIYPQNKDDKPKEKKYIPCKGCDKVFHSQKSYRAHVVIHDGLTYPCPICGKLFQWKRNLSRHTRNHREREAGTAHECRECGKTFASRDCYNNHMRLSKRHAAPSNYGHECNYCGKKFPTKWCMVDHIDWEHLKRVKYECSVCFKAFKTAKIMVAHMNNIHEGKKREAEGEHLCDVCGKSYKTVKRLKGHVWAMHTQRSGTKSFKCKLCAATFLWQTSIYKHVRMMHSTRAKPARPIPAKKQDPYPEMDILQDRMYFQNVASVTNGAMPMSHPVIANGL